MATELENVDELEALLSDLDGGTPPPAKEAPKTDADVVDAEIISETPVTRPNRGVRKVKPLPEDVAAAKAAASEDAEAALDDLGDLSGLEGLDTAPAPSTASTTQAADELDGLEGLDDLDGLGTELAGGLIGNAIAEAQAENTAAEPTKTVAGIKVATVQEAPEELKAAVKADVAAEANERAAADAELASLVEEASAPKAATVVTAGVGAGVAGVAHAAVGKASASALEYVPTKPLKTFIDEVRLQEDLSFSTNNLSLAMTRQAALFAHYARLAAEATYQADRAKQQVELIEAELDQTFRDGLTAAGTKFTEAMIKSMIVKDGSYQAAQSRAFEAKAIAKMVGTAADSFDHRKDMLIQVGADAREEKKGNLRMKEHPGEAAVRVIQEQQS